MEGYIDLEKLSNSIETLSIMENIVNYMDLAENFEEIEKLCKKVNFEHANCIKYKELLEIIYEDIDNVKRKVNELIEALKRTIQTYSKVESITGKDIQTLAEIYQETPASAKLIQQLDQLRTTPKNVYTASLVQIGDAEQNVTVIPPVSTEQQSNTTTSNDPIDTVPIGVAIGLTGVVGSIGAVAINEKTHQARKKKRSNPTTTNDFKVQVYKGDTDIPKELDTYDEYFTAPSEEESIPYHAARMEREADKFYGNQLNDIIPQQKELELDDDDEDDDFEE